MLRFTLLLPLLIPSFACADEWARFAESCSDLQFPALNEFAKLAHDWEEQEKAAQSHLAELSDHTCPAYLQNANAALGVGAAQAKGTVTLAEYVQAQTQTFREGLTADAGGKNRRAYLAAQYDRLRATLGRFAVDLNKTYCGKFLVERYKFVQGELGNITAKTLGVQTKCPALAGNLAKDSPAPRAPLQRGTGSANGGRAPTGSTAGGASTISGNVHHDDLSGGN